jgi:uncharacterized phage-associated protein
MATAAAVADRFRELSGNTLTPLQLLKLAYIAHGWSFPIRKQGLIGERIEAWQYGPVSRRCTTRLRTSEQSQLRVQCRALQFLLWQLKRLLLSTKFTKFMASIPEGSYLR